MDHVITQPVETVTIYLTKAAAVGSSEHVVAYIHATDSVLTTVKVPVEPLIT